MTCPEPGTVQADVLDDPDGNVVIQSRPPPEDDSIEWLKTVIQPWTYYVRVEAMVSVAMTVPHVGPGPTLGSADAPMNPQPIGGR